MVLIDNLFVVLLYRLDVEIRMQDPKPKSKYQIDLESGIDDPDESPTNVKSWTDFNRSYFHPRSINQVPLFTNMASGESDFTFDSFELGIQTYKEYESEYSTIDESLRKFVEECDMFQGFNVNTDISDSWSGFSTCYMDELKDQYPKSNFITITHEYDYLKDRRIQYKSKGFIDPLENVKKMNELLSLWKLEQVSDIIIPLASPTQWNLQKNEWNIDFKDVNIDDSFYSSALLNCHLDSIMMPLKYRRNRISMADLSNHLNWRGGTKFSLLNGSITSDDTRILDRRMNQNYSWIDNNDDISKIIPFAQYEIVRNGNDNTRLPEMIDEVLDKDSKLKYPLLKRYHIEQRYNMPSSHPPMYSNDTNLNIYTKLENSTKVREFIEYYGKLSESFDFRYGGQGSGMIRDDISEMTEFWWSLHANYNDDNQFEGLFDEDDGGDYEIDD